MLGIIRNILYLYVCFFVGDLDQGCCNHYTLLKFQMKAANATDICMQGTLLGIVSNEKSQVTEWNLGRGLLREATIVESGPSGRRGNTTGQTGFLPIARRVPPPGLSQPATCLHTPLLCSLIIELHGELKET